MKYSQKLNIDFDLSAVNVNDVSFHQTFTKLQKYGKCLNGEYSPTSTYNFNDAEKLICQLPLSLVEKEIPNMYILEVDGLDSDQSMFAPHVDLKRNASINYYIEASNEVTCFYHYGAEDKKLTEVETFVAKPKETWILNVSVPHSVKLVRNKKRKMITFSFSKLKYEEVLMHVSGA